MKLKYKITFHTYWHCGSGLSAGASADAITLKDRNGMPYVPGKTLKGLFKEAVDDIKGFKKELEATEDYLELFGAFDEKNNSHFTAKGFFSNATMEKKEYDAIVSNKAQKFMYDIVAATAITNEGIAKDASLRKIEVTLPCELTGEILDVPESMRELLTQAASYIKSMGVGRHHGLGRCTVIIENEEGGKK